LVADNCFAVPFVNDTHLANDPARDPLFDLFTPRSQFQQVFSWLVPNTRKYGGRPGDCRESGRDRGKSRVSIHAKGGVARTATATRATRRSLAAGSTSAAITLAKRSQLIPDAPPGRLR
jgi:hypothetical protein